MLLTVKVQIQNGLVRQSERGDGNTREIMRGFPLDNTDFRGGLGSGTMGS